jgi:hypothetical protein
MRASAYVYVHVLICTIYLLTQQWNENNIKNKLIKNEWDYLFACCIFKILSFGK